MPNYFKNLEETIANAEGTSTYKKIKFWMNSHLRIIWTLVMMLILFFLCLWVSLKAGNKMSDNTLIESVVPEIRSANDIQSNLEKTTKKLKE